MERNHFLFQPFFLVTSHSNKKSNKLIYEKSPYLLQHAYNPVDWYPWSKEAFQKAKKEDKPIFLSIGYSTCHWCHVMAHESFEDPKVAGRLNDAFVCVKVDREERPDIDTIYMNVCQLMTGRGGWPLTIIMTPDKKPFFAATYIPKESQYGIKGLQELIPEIQQIWTHKKNEVLASGNSITASLQNQTQSSLNQTLTPSMLENTYDQLFHSYDELYGGFGTAPKFPTPHNLLFLLRYWKKTGKTYCLNMVETTLEQMKQGGIYDHIGYGFHRYSTDRKWIVPHFEKMLYDQALLLQAYTEAYQTTKKSLYKKTAFEIVEYITRDMTTEHGGFYSAEDADSEGVEGKFYTWDYTELEKNLTANELQVITTFYSIKKDGNFRHERGQKTRGNIFYQAMSVDEYIQSYKISEKDFFDLLNSIRKKLFHIRSKRIHPGKDDKILTDWNGLLIAALAKAGRTFNEPAYINAAEKSASFISNTLMKDTFELLHMYREGNARIPGFATDYSFLIWGFIELYQATFHPIYLQQSVGLATYLLNHFWDTTSGGLFFTSDTHEQLITKTKEIYDGAIPSSNSVAMYNFIRLARLTGNTDFEQKAREIGNTFSHKVRTMPSAYTQLMIGLDYAIGSSYEIVIVGDKENRDTKQVINQLNSMYLPHAIVLLKDHSKQNRLLEKIAPFVKDFKQINQKPTIYVCKNHKCQLPTTDIAKMKELLAE